MRWDYWQGPFTPMSEMRDGRRKDGVNEGGQSEGLLLSPGGREGHYFPGSEIPGTPCLW